MSEKRPTNTFDFNLKDLELSMREFLLRTPIRIVGATPSALPDLYPSMKSDADQMGVRIGNLFSSERIKVFPSIGLYVTGLLRQGVGYGIKVSTFGFTLDTACMIQDPQGGFDRVATFLQRDQLFSDLMALLCDFENVPFYLWNSDGTRTPSGSFKIRQQNPSPRLRMAPEDSTSIFGFSGDFQVDVVLRKVPNC